MTAASFDANAWYQISEERVDNYTKPFNSNLQTVGSGLDVYGKVGQAWQFMPVDGVDGYYVMRDNTSGVGQQLSACYAPTEITAPKTGICMQPAENATGQWWFITDWGDGSFKLQNVGNGTNYNLDVHPGGPPFVSDATATAVYQPAQHWLISSERPVDDGAWSTLYTDQNLPAQTTDSAKGPSSTGTSNPNGNSNGGPSSTPASGGGLSPGAAAGIAVGATLLAIFLGLGGFLYWRRQRKLRQQAEETTRRQSELAASQMGSPYQEDAKMGSYPQQQWSPAPPFETSAYRDAVEVQGVQRPAEVAALEPHVELDANQTWRRQNLEGGGQ